METTDSSQLGTYIKDRLIAFNVPIDSKMISKHFILPREKNEKIVTTGNWIYVRQWGRKRISR